MPSWEDLISSNTPSPPPSWLSEEAAPPPVTPMSFSDDPWAQAPQSSSAPSSSRRALKVPLVAVVVVLFVVGVIVSIALPMYWASTAPPAVQTPQPVDVPPPWRPEPGPLTQGLVIDAVPQSVAWSTDARQLGWSIFNDEESYPVVTVVGVGKAGFTTPQEVESAPSWMSRPPPSVVRARVEGDLIILNWAEGEQSGENAGVVNLRSLLGLQAAHSPAVVTYGPRTWLAFVGELDAQAEGEAPRRTLHVFDVTDLIR